jgi:hypothetical protein
MRLNLKRCIKCGNLRPNGLDLCQRCTETELSVVMQELHETKQRLSSAALEAEQHKSCASLIKLLDSLGKELGAKLERVRSALG